MDGCSTHTYRSGNGFWRRTESGSLVAWCLVVRVGRRLEGQLWLKGALLSIIFSQCSATMRRPHNQGLSLPRTPCMSTALAPLCQLATGSRPTPFSPCSWSLMQCSLSRYWPGMSCRLGGHLCDGCQVLTSGSWDPRVAEAVGTSTLYEVCFLKNSATSKACVLYFLFLV